MVAKKTTGTSKRKSNQAKRCWEPQDGDGRIPGMIRLSQVIEKEILEPHEWTWSDLVRMTGITSSTIYSYFSKHERLPEMPKLFEVADVLTDIPGCEMFKPSVLVAAIEGSDWKEALKSPHWPYGEMPSDEKFVDLWMKMTSERRRRLIPVFLELIAREAWTGPVTEAPVRLGKLTAESFSDGYGFGAEGIARKCAELGYDVSPESVEDVLSHFKDPLKAKDLSDVEITELTALGRVIRNEDGAVGPENVPLVLEFAGVTTIQQVLTKFMAEHELQTTDELIDWLLEFSGFTLTRADRKKVLLAFGQAIYENTMISSLSPAYPLLMELGRVLHFDGEDSFGEFLRKHNPVEETA